MNDFYNQESWQGSSHEHIKPVQDEVRVASVVESVYRREFKDPDSQAVEKFLGWANDAMSSKDVIIKDEDLEITPYTSPLAQKSSKNDAVEILHIPTGRRAYSLEGENSAKETMISGLKNLKREMISVTGGHISKEELENRFKDYVAKAMEEATAPKRL